MSLPRYPKYKDSGVEWLGEVPEYWHVAPLKRGFEVCLGKMLQNDAAGDEDVLRAYLRAANIQWAGVDISDVKKMWFSPRDRSQLRLKFGDLLVSEGGDVGRSAIWQGEIEECYIQNSINRVRTKADNSTKYLYYWMSTIKDKGYIDVLCNKSTIAHFTAEKVAEVPVSFPPGTEQTAIATFLDRETVKIDALIAEQEKLLSLLAEKRQATISHAVTKGLNPDVPMKDSGVEWLGDVPEHWDMVRIKALSHFTTSGPRGWSDRICEDGSLFIQSGDLNDSLGLEFETAKRVNVGDEAEATRTRLAEGDVVVCITGAKTGNVALCMSLCEPAYINQHLCLIRPTEKVLGRFLALALKSNLGQTQFELSQYGLKQGLSLENVREIWVAQPPLEEQNAIISFLDAEIDKLTTLALVADVGVTLLKERRSALISAAVTGKIDVRNLVAEEVAA